MTRGPTSAVTINSMSLLAMRQQFFQPINCVCSMVTDSRIDMEISF
jgi:hypothetical protein